MKTKHTRNALRRAVLQGIGTVTALGLTAPLLAADLQSVEYDRIADGQIQVRMTFSEPLEAVPESFRIDSPPRVAIDLPDVRNRADSRRTQIGLEGIESVTVAETTDRTRAVFNLARPIGYTLSTEGNDLLVTFREAEPAPRPPVVRPRRDEVADRIETAEVTETSSMVEARVDGGAAHPSVDFRRGENGEGRLILDVGGTNIPLNLRREGLDVVVDLPATRLEAGRYDVRDFGTPITRVDIRPRAEGTEVRLQTRDAGEHLAWQTGNQLTVEVQTIPEVEPDDPLQPKVYTGERLTLKFQDIEVRPLLQLLADFTGNNIVVSDSVGGSMSLRLENVPWDQAFDLILTTRGLSSRQNGNVIFVAPTQELAARDAAELEARQRSEELAPLMTDIVQINYAQAAEIATLLESDQESGQFLSVRGSITVDARTNTLVVHDIADNIRRMRDLIGRLDRPIKQVLIETRIVIATDNFQRELGTRWGVTAGFNSGNSIISTTGSGEGTGQMTDTAVANMQNTGQPFPIGLPDQPGRWNVNLPVADPTGQIGLSILGSNVLLDLELSALQAEGAGEIISNPKVITQNGHEAYIKRGQRVPFVTTSQNGTNVEFQDAMLETKVTPQITPNNNIILDIEVRKDEPDQTFLVQGNPAINEREVKTKVQVRNGETVVLGGIYEYTNIDQMDKVPFLGDLPALGNLFKRINKENTRFELLIFVTPKIVEGDQVELAAN
ncbi:MAG: type IV pilus secretin PilQ [Halothiobacillaceae bacterium]